MAPSGEPLSSVPGILFAGPGDLAALRGGARPDVLAFLCDLADPALAEFRRLPPNAADLRDAARPGASPRTWFHLRRALTRSLVGWRFGVAPEEVTIGYDASGAPRIHAPAEGGFVSVASRGSLAAVALADVAVGIDVEPVGGAFEPVWDVLHAAERARLHDLPGAVRHGAFLEIWTAKEAGLKALGQGFTRDPSGVIVESDGADGFRLMETGRLHATGRWHAKSESILAVALHPRSS
jgi:4'-phosphopantetheinyl transferase